MAGKDYKGVKGWLLFLCVNLAILDPVGGFINLMIVTDVVKPQFAQDPGLYRLMLVGGTCSICLIVYSLYAGVCLWRALPGAVKTARKYLIFSFLYGVLSMYLPVLAGVSEETRNELNKTAFLSLLFVTAYVAIWYSYLARSKRVKATYGDG